MCHLKAWKKLDPSFPFEDAHSETYSVRDDSSKETLIKRLHERLRCLKILYYFWNLKLEILTHYARK